MLEAATPLLLTYNEMPNLERTFAPLAWAKRIVVVDSGSTDGTREWLARDRRVAVYSRDFDYFAQQGEFGLRETEISTPWVLSLDADHVLTGELVREFEGLRPAPDVDAFDARFVYCIQGRKLRGGLYPPRIVLARLAAARFIADGHAHRLAVGGRVVRLEGAVLHDDRKPRSRFLAAQAKYAPQEADKLLTAPAGTLSTADRIRRLGWVAPWLVPLWCLVLRAGVLDGAAGWIYAGERATAEWILSMEILGRRLKVQKRRGRA